MGDRFAHRFRWLVRSSTLRLTLLLSSIFAVGMVLAIILALVLGRNAVLDRIDATLAGLAETVAADEAPADTMSIVVRPLSNLGDLPRPFARVAEKGGGTVNLDDDFRFSEEWRVLVTRDSRDVPILIALPLEDSEDALELLSGVLWTTAGFVLVFVLAVGVGVGLLAQRRLLRIKNTLDSLAAGDLQARTGISSNADDLDDLSRRLDNTAAELERLVAQTRNLSASLAHDLRTPLARLHARLEALPEGEEREVALKEASRLSGIFDTIMRVARIEAAQGRDGFASVDLGELAIDVAETFDPVVQDNGKVLEIDGAQAATVQADKTMLVQALANLIQNAIVHGGPKITLFARDRAIGVADNGKGVDPASYDEIVKPMVRLDDARGTDGTGLGLALVRAVADRHGATLQLAEGIPSGLRVTLNFTEM